MRDDLRGYVLEHFADPAAVLVVDETGDQKGTANGGRSAAVHRDRRADRERPGRGLPGLCRSGRVRVHRPRLYLPRSWIGPDRCRAAGVPEDTAFATKPALATEMITWALDAGDARRRG